MRLAMLRPLYERPGPWASVHLEASRNVEDAVAALELRWRAARTTLAAAGCDAATLDALQEAVLDHPPQTGRYGLAAFAANGEVALVRPTAVPPRETVAFWPLPDAMPLVVQLGEEIPFIRVVVNHLGAEVVVAGPDRLVCTETVRGPEDFPIRKVKAGGWRQARLQQAVQERWRRNAAEVAQAVADLADRHGAEIIVVGGDPRSRPLLVQQLPERWRGRVVPTDVVGRADAGEPEPLDEATVRAVADRAAAHEEEILDRFRAQRAHDGAAGDGLPAVVTALQRSQVETVLLAAGPAATVSAADLWIGPEPLQLSFDPAELRAMSVADPRRVRADAAVVRALTCTDAGLTLVGPDELGGSGDVAALLRYADAGTRHH